RICGEELFRRFPAQALARGSVLAARCFGKLEAFALGLGAGESNAVAALDHRAREQPGDPGRSEVSAHRPASGRSPRDGDVARVTAEGVDVVVDPLERRLLVQ